MNAGKIKTPVIHLNLQALIQFDSKVVGMTGFEPATPSSRTKYATGLRYIPNLYCPKLKKTLEKCQESFFKICKY